MAASDALAQAMLRGLNTRKVNSSPGTTSSAQQRPRPTPPPKPNELRVNDNMQQSEDNQKKDLVSMTKLYQQTKLPPRNSAPHTVQARIPKNKEMHIKSKIPPPRPPPRTEGRPPSEESEKVGGSSIPPQNSNTPSDSKEEKRIKIATEIYTSEKSYCKTLQVVVSEYLHPLQLDSGILKKDKRETIFSNIEEIMNLHLPMLYDLDQCMKGESCDAAIGEIIMKTASYFSVYKVYCAHYGESLLCLQECKDKYLKFAAFLENKDDLASMLIQPVQRVPRYRLLLAELLKCTPETHPDYEPCEKALLKIEDVAIHVNESVRAKENQEKLLQIQESFSGKCPELVSPERKFIREGVLVKMCRRVPKRRYFFLFNDLLIYGAANESTAKTTYTFHRSLNIKNLRVQDLPATDGMSHAFQLLSDQKSFAVFADSKESKQAWMDDIVYAKNYGKEVNLRQSQGSFQADIAPVWVPDKLVKNCMQCNTKFTAINRRHHCRKCGSLVCGSCSSKKFLLPNIGKICRVCNICFDELSGNTSSTKPRVNSNVDKFSEEKKQNLAKFATAKFRGTEKGPNYSFTAKAPEYESILKTSASKSRPAMPSFEQGDRVSGRVSLRASKSETNDQTSPRIIPAPIEDMSSVDDSYLPPPPMNEDGTFKDVTPKRPNGPPPVRPRIPRPVK